MRLKYLFFFLLSINLNSQIELNNLFTDNMVLQQNSNVNFWGSADIGEELVINTTWSEESFRTKVRNNGTWFLKIKTPKAGGPYSISILCNNDTKLIENILIGEVWLASGQSNMEMTLSGRNREPVIGSQDMIAKSNNPNIRFITVGRKTSDKPETTFSGNWVESSHKTSPKFSAVAYSYANYLNEVLDVPVGIIHSSFGGSPAEAWINNKTLNQTLSKEELNYNIKSEHHKPSSLFNGMINPIIPFNINGVIWYQGESNVSRYKNYTQVMNNLIRSWRSEWGLGDFSFYFVQIAPNGSTNQGDGTTQAFLREAQLKTMQSMKNTGMVVTLDIGSTYTNHPPEKKLVGKRLAYWALAKDYGYNNLKFSGPIYDSHNVSDGKVYVKFKYAVNGVTSFGNELNGFEIAGIDKVFYDADASIDSHWSAKPGERSVLILKSDKVPNPLYIRYAWKNYIDGSLYNVEGLPASSFRSYNFE